MRLHLFDAKCRQLSLNTISNTDPFAFYFAICSGEAVVSPCLGAVVGGLLFKSGLHVISNSS